MNFDLKDISKVLAGGNFSEDEAKSMAQLAVPQFTISDVGITHRWITHWDDVGLIDQKRENGSWRRFSFLEYVWLRIIVELRNFKVPLETIKKLKGNLFQPIQLPIDETLKELQERGDIVLPEWLTKEMIEENMQEAMEMQTGFLFSVLNAIKSRKPMCLLISLDGQFEILDLTNPTITELTTELLFLLVERRNFISINIQNILQEFYSNDKIRKEVIESIMILSPKEKELLEYIRNEDFKEILIKQRGDSEGYTLTITKALPVDDISYRVLGMLSTDSLEEIVIQGNKGKVFRFEKTTKVTI